MTGTVRACTLADDNSTPLVVVASLPLHGGYTVRGSRVLPCYTCSTANLRARGASLRRAVLLPRASKVVLGCWVSATPCCDEAPQRRHLKVYWAQYGTVRTKGP